MPADTESAPPVILPPGLSSGVPSALPAAGVVSPRRRWHVTVLALFFASGFVALLYQVIWQRLLALVTGLDLYAVTLIVAVFMLGMGAGSYAGGVWADRWPVPRLLAGFAVAEAVVAAFALASKALYHDLLYGLAVSAGASPGLALAGAATLLVPTFFMGMTLPLLSCALTESLATAPAGIARLYAWNTLGAAAGAWLGSAVVIRGLGYERSLWLGAAVNLVAAATAIWLARQWRGADADRRPHKADPAAGALPMLAPGQAGSDADPAGELRSPAGEVVWPWPVWIGLYFLSGFIALGLELVWFRLLGVVLKSTAFTFPLLLGFYLLGVGGGSLIGRMLAGRCERPTQWFLVAQAGVGLYAGASVSALLWGLRTQEWLAPLRGYLAQYEPIDFAFNFGSLASSQLAIYVAVPALLILPPTLLMGISFSLLQRGVQRRRDEVGRRVAVLQTANIIGSTLGTILVGIVLIDRLGTSGTLQWLTLGGGLFLALAAVDRVGRQRLAVRLMAVAASAGLAVAAALSLPEPATFWGELHGVPPTRIIHQEDGTGLAVLTSPDPFFRRRTDVYVNGLGQSTIPFNGLHSFLGLVPVLLHPEPRRLAIIGLGSGDTLYSAAGRPETSLALGVEIIAGQVDTLRRLHARTGYVGLGQLFSDPRVQLTVGDGRRLIMQSPERFDVIEADALRPGSAYSGNLYSREYFELLRGRLAPGGFAVTWAPTPRIYETFLAVFPHVAAVPPMLIGSNEPIPFDAAAVRARAARDETARYYERAGIELERHVEQMLSTFTHERQGEDRPPAPAGSINTDLFPRDELHAW